MIIEERKVETQQFVGQEVGLLFCKVGFVNDFCIMGFIHMLLLYGAMVTVLLL